MSSSIDTMSNEQEIGHPEVEAAEGGQIDLLQSLEELAILKEVGGGGLRTVTK